MADEDTATIDHDTADFDAGFSGETVDKTVPTKEKPESAETPRITEEPEQEHVKITAKEWAEIKAVASKTASYDQQLSRLFGTTGNIQKLLNESKANSASSATGGGKIAIPKDAFAAMEKDFPELAQQTRAALESALSGVQGGVGVDQDSIKAMLAAHTTEREAEALKEDHPDWYKIVGGVDASKGEQPDPNNPFRKWLATKDEAYSKRISETESPAVIGRAIRLFRNETKAQKPVAVTPRTDARADRIRSAVQPRGDNAGAAPGKSEDDDFEAGFKSR